MTLTQAITKLKEYYEKAKVTRSIKKPISWSLYKTWQYVDKYERERDYIHE